MALRFSSKNAVVAVAGTTFTHGLQRAAAATAPDEWSFNHFTAPPAPSAGGGASRAAARRGASPDPGARWCRSRGHQA